MSSTPMPSRSDLQLIDTTPVVTEGAFLTLHYALSAIKSDGSSRVFLSTFDNLPATLSMGGGQLSPQLEAALMGLPEGAKHSVDLPAGTAFGDHNAGMVQWIAAHLLQELGQDLTELKVGDVLQFPHPDDASGAQGLGGMAGTVVALRPSDAGAPSPISAAQIDFNHPLAGLAVRFEAHIIGVL